MTSPLFKLFPFGLLFLHRDDHPALCCSHTDHEKRLQKLYGRIKLKISWFVDQHSFGLLIFFFHVRDLPCTFWRLSVCSWFRFIFKLIMFWLRKGRKKKSSGDYKITLRPRGNYASVTKQICHKSLYKRTAGSAPEPRTAPIHPTFVLETTPSCCHVQYLIGILTLQITEHLLLGRILKTLCSPTGESRGCPHGYMVQAHHCVHSSWHRQLGRATSQKCSLLSIPNNMSLEDATLQVEETQSDAGTKHLAPGFTQQLQVATHSLTWASGLVDTLYFPLWWGGLIAPPEHSC